MDHQQEAARQFLRDTEEFNQRTRALGLGDVSGYYWYHTVELPYGLVTPGQYDMRAALPRFGFADNMRGLNVLDVGSATGYFAFEFEKRGARVTSVELPSLYSLDRFPGQPIEQIIDKIGRMTAPAPSEDAHGYIKKYSAEELYFFLLEGPFEFCRKLLNSAVKRCYSSVYDLSAEKLGVDGFDLVFMGDILLHTLNPLAALAAVAPLCKREMVLAQVIPGEADDQPVMQYVGGSDLSSDEVSWWLPNKACLVQLLKKLGFREVVDAGIHTGQLRTSGYVYERSILRALK